MKKTAPFVDGLHDSTVRNFIIPIQDILINGVNDSKRVVFICGKDKSDRESYRYKISKILEQHTKYQLAYPENLFEDLLEGQANNSLLSLEAQLAEAVDLIILIISNHNLVMQAQGSIAMFDFQVSQQSHFENACRAFAARHNIRELADKIGMNQQTLRNKLNPDQMHQLTAPEIAVLTDVTEDATQIDGLPWVKAGWRSHPARLWFITLAPKAANSLAL